MSTPVNYELLASTSIAGDVSSAPFLAVRLKGFSVQCVTTGSAAGTLKLQASNDAGVIPELGEQSATGITNWDDVTTVAVSGAGPYTFDSINQNYRWARVTYVHTSGTGNMAVRVSGKTVR